MKRTAPIAIFTSAVKVDDSVCISKVSYPALKFRPGIPTETAILTEPSGKPVVSQSEISTWQFLAIFQVEISPW